MTFTTFILISSLVTVVSAISSDKRATPTGQIVTATVRSTVTLICDVGETVFDLVEWRRNDTSDDIFIQYQNFRPSVHVSYINRVTLKDGKNLQIANLNLGDEDTYFCKVVSLKSGTTSQSSPIKLLVHDKSQSKEPKKEVMEAPTCDGPKEKFIAKVLGSTVLLTCYVRGNPPPKIEWTKDGGPLPKGRHTVTTKGLTIKSLHREDSGSYQVTLTSSAGQYAHVIEVIVKTSASVLPGHYINAVENQMQTIPCGRTRVDSSSTVSWTGRNGARATNNPRFTLDTATGGLIINRADRNDSGSYNCSIMKIEGREFKITTYEMFFNVQYHPEIIYFYPEVTALVGDSTYFPCVAIGNPAANISWQHKGQPLSKSPRFTINSNGSLIIEDIRREDEGIYTCTPINKWTGKKKHATLQVLVPPEFINSPSFAQNVEIGANVTFDCMARGFPKPNITWYTIESSGAFEHVFTSKDGVLTIRNVRLSDHARYRCYATSVAGTASRDFMLFLKTTPYKPVNITTESFYNITTLSWASHANGVIVEEFELWYRPLNSTEYEWQIYLFKQFGSETANITGVLSGNDVIFRMRGKNPQGLGPFSDAYIVFKNGTGIEAVKDERKEATPMAPYGLQVNETSKGFLFTWKNVFAPGRPSPDYFVIERRDGNRSWTAIKVNGNVDKYFLPSEKASNRGFTFKMYAVGVWRSDYVEPTVFKEEKITEKKRIPPIVAAKSKGKKDDPWPAIILGVIFSVFVLILIISLLCFLRATGRLGGSRARRNCGEELLDEKNENDGTLRNGNDSKASNGLKVVGDKAFYKKNSKKAKPFHFDNCPIKLISDYDGTEYEKLLLESSAHVIFSESPEKCECEYRRCMTLPRKPGTRPMKAPKASLYKCASLPNGMTSGNGMDRTTETMVEDEDYDTEDEDFVDSKFPTIDRKFSKMKKSKMIDSYDQFCRSASDFGSKDIVSTPKTKKSDVDFYVSPHEDEAKVRLISPTEADQCNLEASNSPTESSRGKIHDELVKNKDANSDSGSPPQGSKENVFEDPNDASSENSTAESDRRPFSAGPASRLRHPSAKPGYAVRSPFPDDIGNEKLLTVDRALTAIKESPRASNDSVEKHSLRSYEIRSSGFESEGKPPSTSDTESVLNSMPPLTSGFRFKDYDVMSDISTRSSPGPLRRAMPSGSYDEHYEWDIPKRRTYGRPIYNSLRKDRYQNHRLSMDNEDLFQSIMKMQKQLGVEIDDSWENLSEDTNLSLVGNTQTPFYRDGYTSDVPSSFTDKVSSYTEREKTRRCAELLEELKRNKGSTSSLPRTSNLKRSQSAVSDYLRSKPVLPPIQRSNSVCEEETTVYHEWLV
ncbi:protein turtle-like [Rhopilema esculentum]|uniref:protein turtle-like n=1 Tax=Rhopilema esculentum TaxID=499914 RepID=UPI0031D9993B